MFFFSQFLKPSCEKFQKTKHEAQEKNKKYPEMQIYLALQNYLQQYHLGFKGDKLKTWILQVPAAQF